MSFSKLIDRLVWLVIVAATVLAVGMAGLLALAFGTDHVRVGLTVSGALIVVILVAWIHAVWQGRPRRRQRAAPYAEGASWAKRPMPAPVPSSHLLWKPLEPSVDTTVDTRPMRPVQIEEPPHDLVEDTKPTAAMKPGPVYTAPSSGRGPYDDLFPPPEPGDEDYLEYDHETTAKTATHIEPSPLPPDEQPTTPIGPVTPQLEPPEAKPDAEPEARIDTPDQPGEPRESAPSAQSESETLTPPDNSPA